MSQDKYNLCSKDTRKSNTTEQIAYDGIINMIMDGKLQPGTRFIERQIADYLKISRTPVRNAMRTLSSEGLLENRTTGGYILPKLSLKDMTDLYKIRFNIEPLIAYEAAINAEKKDEKYFLELIQTERDEFYSGKRDIYKTNRDIHGGIAALTDNRYMKSLQRHLFWRSQIYVVFFDNFYYATASLPIIRDPDKSISHIRHRELIQAVFSNNSADAKRHMTMHLTETWQMLCDNITSTKNGYGRMLISDWDFNLPKLPSI